jgi:hypothetical protein
LRHEQRNASSDKHPLTTHVYLKQKQIFYQWLK